VAVPGVTLPTKLKGAQFNILEDETHWLSLWIHFIHQMEVQVTTKCVAGCIVNTVQVLNKTAVKINMGRLDKIVRDLRLEFGVLTHSYVRHNCLNLMGYWLFAL
jgi:hypothetical protein